MQFLRAVGGRGLCCRGDSGGPAGQGGAFRVPAPPAGDGHALPHAADDARAKEQAHPQQDHAVVNELVPIGHLTLTTQKC